jgi:hypothetical protein
MMEMIGVACLVFIALGSLFSLLRATRKKRSNLTSTAEAEELKPLLGVVHPREGKEGK